MDLLMWRRAAESSSFNRTQIPSSRVCQMREKTTTNQIDAHSLYFFLFRSRSAHPERRMTKKKKNKRARRRDSFFLFSRPFVCLPTYTWLQQYRSLAAWPCRAVKWGSQAKGWRCQAFKSVKNAANAIHWKTTPGQSHSRKTYTGVTRCFVWNNSAINQQSSLQHAERGYINS